MGAPAQHPRHPRWYGGRRRGAFTLIEILIVIVVLGIMATIIIPQFSNASLTARENTLKDELRYLRMQVGIYKAQHRDVPPGYPGGNMSNAPTADAFVDQMTRYTDETGNISSVYSNLFRFGPYLSAMPANTLTGLSGVLIVGSGDPMPAATGKDYGWYYRPSTGDIVANALGADSSGKAYIDY